MIILHGMGIVTHLVEFNLTNVRVQRGDFWYCLAFSLLYLAVITVPTTLIGGKTVYPGLTFANLYSVILLGSYLFSIYFAFDLVVRYKDNKEEAINKSS